MKTGCPVILQGTVNLQRKVFRITKWISSHNHLAVEGKDTKTVDSNTQIKLVKKNQNVIQRTEVVENKQMDDSVTEGFYVNNNEGDLLEDNQLIHLWPIKNIFTELERNIRLDITSTVQIKTNMLRELLRKFFIIDEDKKKQAADISPVHSTEQRSSPGVILNQTLQQEESLAINLPSCSSWQKFDHHVVPAEESEEEEVLTQKILTSFSSDHPVIPAEVLQDGEVLPQGDSPSQSPLQLSDQLISLPSFTPLSVQQEASNGLSQPLTFIQPSSNNNSGPDVQNFKNIIVDNVIPRGRPKRSKRPAIGEEYLSFPSKLLKSNRNDDLINFLNHLIPESKIKSVVNKDTLVTLDDMKNKINPVSDAVPGGFLKVKRIKNYFDAAAYQCLTNKIKEKNDDTQSWSCNECLKKINDELQDSIECEKC